MGSLAFKEPTGMKNRIVWLSCAALLGLSVTSVLAQSPSAPAGPAPGIQRAFVALEGGAQVTPTSAESSVTYKLYGEDAVLSAGYDTTVVPVIGARAGMRVWRRLVVGVGASLFGSNGSVTVTGRLPHPFFFQRPRTLDGTASGIKRDEAVIYGELGWLVPLSPRLDVLLFAGPAFFTATQEAATKLAFTEQYPFDTATFSSVEVVSKKVTATGFTVGADLAYRLGKAWRVGILLRYSYAPADVEPVAGQPFDITLGGLQTTAGLRIRF
ncbi:MAG: outer membrane beta-barrel protein [Vicinamibacterales bacterium]|nr:outer membrane beta-barrel protein [Vicinamibacterales bacterium]